MINKEIISNLRGLIGKYNLTDEEWQTIEKTIKVLNNSDEDYISRIEVNAVIDKWIRDNKLHYIIPKELSVLSCLLDNLSSVEPNCGAEMESKE